MQFSDIGQYNYNLPQELIRKKPLEPRDSARLFVYDTKTDTITFDIFRNLAQYLPPKSLIVLNDTRVIPVRLILKKETGGKIEVFVLVNAIVGKSQEFPVLLDRKGNIGQKLLFPNGDFFVIMRQQEEVFFVRLESNYTLFELLYRYGTTPIPHYLVKGDIDESVLRQRYQTIFAKHGASVAAPTAALHFTPKVFDNLKRNDIKIAKITLDVGRGTFAPITECNFLEKKLHSERVAISSETAAQLNMAKRVGQPIVAVGTTVVRTLETVGKNQRFQSFSGCIDTFIYPPYRFTICDALITNFHLPKTSLMLLVDAFLEYKQAKRRVLSVYEQAIKERFSFYSFGDSLLIL